MATAITIAPGSNTADVADKGIAGIPARYIARYAAKFPHSKRFEITVANEVYDVTVETPKVEVKTSSAPKAAPATKVVKAKAAPKAVEAKKRVRPSRSKAAIAEREAAKK